jgi:predicted dehydrogenase
MEKVIRFGIWGTGAIAQQLAADFGLAHGAGLYAVGSRTLERAREFASLYGATKAYAGLDAMLADEAVDVVYIASPNHQHAADCLRCIEAGKAVLCEKPFAVDEHEATSIVRAARAQKVFCMEAMWTRFIPAIVETKRLIEAGEIGNIGLLQGNFATVMPNHSDSRFESPERGGGALLDLGVYLISLAQYLLGEPDKVAGMAVRLPNGMDLTSTIQLGWRSGAVAAFASSLSLDGTNDAVIFGAKGRVRLVEPFYRPHRLEIRRHHATDIDRVPGALGRSIGRSRRPPTAMLIRRALSPAVSYLKRGSVRRFLFPGNGYQFQLLEVVRCLREGQLESTRMPLDDSLAVLRTMDAVRKQWEDAG